MIITCPQCETRFLIPSTAFANGPRKVRCSSCKHSWVHDGKEGGADPDADLLERIVPRDQDKEKAEGKRATAAYPFIIGFVIVIVGYMAMQMASSPLVMGQGLAFNNIAIERGEDQSLVITGEVVNAMNEKRGVPPIKITGLSESGMAGDSFVFNPEKDILAPAEIMPLSLAIKNLPAEVVSLKVTFDLATKGDEEKAIESDDHHEETEDHVSPPDAHGEHEETPHTDSHH